MKSEIKVIDYLIENGGCDTCGKCAYAKPLDENGDISLVKNLTKTVVLPAVMVWLNILGTMNNQIKSKKRVKEFL